MNLLRYPGLELPIYSEDDVAYTTNDIRQAARSGVGNFVRRACVRYEGPERNLKTILALGDRVLSNVCETIGIDVVGYTWGLAPLSKSNRARLLAQGSANLYDSGLTSYTGNLDTSLIPAGYGLVASVDVIPDARGYLDYLQEGKVFGNGSPSDIGVEVDGYLVTNEDLRQVSQFVSDPAKYHQSSMGIVLIDPEPRLRMTPIS